MKRSLRAQSQGHHTIDRLEERGAERGSARRCESKKKAIVKSDEHLNYCKASTGRNLSDWVKRIIIMGFFRANKYHLELN